MRRLHFFFWGLFFLFWAGWLITGKTLVEFVTWAWIAIPVCILGVFAMFLGVIAMWNDFNNTMNVLGTYPVIWFITIVMTTLILNMIQVEIRPTLELTWVKYTELGLLFAILVCILGSLVPEKSKK